MSEIFASSCRRGWHGVDGGAGEHAVFGRHKALCGTSEDGYKHAAMLVDHRYNPACELQYDPKYDGARVLNPHRYLINLNEAA